PPSVAAREYPPRRADSQPPGAPRRTLRAPCEAGYDGVMPPPGTRQAAVPSTHEPPWPAAVAECRRILEDLIAIDTSNPPGRELEAVRCVEALLAREGIAGRTFEAAPGRGNFVARVPGRGAKQPLLLLGHLDVVGVERGEWASDPFRMVERDGFLYGR